MDTEAIKWFLERRWRDRWGKQLKVDTDVHVTGQIEHKVSRKDFDHLSKDQLEQLLEAHNILKQAKQARKEAIDAEIIQEADDG